MNALAADCKRCTKCGETRPVAEFGPNKRMRDGLNSNCRPCRRAAKRKWAADNAQRVAEYNKGWKAENPRYHAEWQKDNRDSLRALERARYADNREAAAEKRHRLYRKHRDKRTAYARAWSKEHPHLRVMYMAERRARVRQATPAWADRSKIADYYDLAGLISAETGVAYHVDHIVPLVSPLVCGLHCEHNLQILQGAVNASKNNRFSVDAGPTVTGVTL